MTREVKWETKMDEKVKEIEHKWDMELNSLLSLGYLELGKHATEDIKILLSHIKKQDLDREITYKDTLEQAEAKVKELEAKLTREKIALDITTGALEGSQGVIKELKEGIEKQKGYLE